MNRQEKINKAKELLFEVKQEDLALQREITDSKQIHLCTCGCKRGRHGVSHSINYTDGPCIDCDCMGFNYSISKNEPAQKIAN